MLKRILSAVAGVVVMIGIWEVKGRLFGSPSTGRMETSFPAKVWDGGGGMYTFETESTEPTVLEVVFNEGGHPEDDSVEGPEDGKHLVVRVDVPAGAASFVTEAPAARAGGDVILSLKEPAGGKRFRLVVRRDGAVVREQAYETDPATPTYGIVLQMDDWSKADFAGD